MDTAWVNLDHAYGDAADLPPLLEACALGDTPQCLAALRALRERIFHQGSVYTATGPALTALVHGLSPERPDPTVACAMLLFDVLARVGPSLSAARIGQADEVLRACDKAFREAVPRLEALMEADDRLVQSWALHLLSWMPDPIEGLATRSLERLAPELHPVLAITAALATAINPETRGQCVDRLRTWIGAGGQPSRVAAMVLPLLRGHPQRPDAIDDETYATLLDMARGPVWDHWNGAPARYQGFYADLASNLVRCGYHRADRSLPALLHMLDSCPDREVEPLVLAILKLWYHAHPYDGVAQLSALSPLQAEVLERVARASRAWEMPYQLPITLDQLGLPVDAPGLLTFLGKAAEGGASGARVTGVDGDFVTLNTELTPAELVAMLNKRSS